MKTRSNTAQKQHNKPSSSLTVIFSDTELEEGDYNYDISKQEIRDTFWSSSNAQTRHRRISAVYGLSERDITDTCFTAIL